MLAASANVGAKIHYLKTGEGCYWQHVDSIAGYERAAQPDLVNQTGTRLEKAQNSNMANSISKDAIRWFPSSATLT